MIIRRDCTLRVGSRDPEMGSTLGRGFLTLLFGARRRVIILLLALVMVTWGV